MTSQAPAKHHGKKTKKVYCRTIFLKIGEVDSKNEKFTAEAFIESHWDDDEFFLKLIQSQGLMNKIRNPNNVNEADIIDLIKGLKEMNFEAKKNWLPDLFVENALGDPKETVKYKMEIAPRDHFDPFANEISLNALTVRVTEQRKVEGVFYERLELYDFPIDLQEISIKLSSKKSIDEVLLLENENEKCYVNHENFMDQQQYNLFEHVKIAHDTIEDHWRKYTRSQFIVSSFVIRKLGFYIYNAYLLIFLITTLGFATFSISVTTPHFRCQVTGLLLLTSVNFRWIITQRLPSVSYLTLIDKYTIGCLFSLSGIFCWHAIIGSKVITSDSGTMSTIDGYVLYAMAAIYIIFVIIMVIWASVLSIKVYLFKKEHSMLMIEKEQGRLDRKKKNEDAHHGHQEEKEPHEKKGAKKPGKDINSSKTEIMTQDELEKSRTKAYKVAPVKK